MEKRGAEIHGYPHQKSAENPLDQLGDEVGAKGQSLSVADRKHLTVHRESRPTCREGAE